MFIALFKTSVDLKAYSTSSSGNRRLHTVPWGLWISDSPQAEKKSVLESVLRFMLSLPEALNSSVRKFMRRRKGVKPGAVIVVIIEFYI